MVVRWYSEGGCSVGHATVRLYGAGGEDAMLDVGCNRLTSELGKMCIGIRYSIDYCSLREGVGAECDWQYCYCRVSKRP